MEQFCEIILKKYEESESKDIFYINKNDKEFEHFKFYFNTDSISIDLWETKRKLKLPETYLNIKLQNIYGPNIRAIFNPYLKNEKNSSPCIDTTGTIHPFVKNDEYNQKINDFFDTIKKYLLRTKFSDYCNLKSIFTEDEFNNYIKLLYKQNLCEKINREIIDAYPETDIQVIFGPFSRFAPRLREHWINERDIYFS